MTRLLFIAASVNARTHSLTHSFVPVFSARINASVQQRTCARLRSSHATKSSATASIAGGKYFSIPFDALSGLSDVCARFEEREQFFLILSLCFILPLRWIVWSRLGKRGISSKIPRPRVYAHCYWKSGYFLFMFSLFSLFGNIYEIFLKYL